MGIEELEDYLARFKVVVRWMQEDVERSIFDARANLLVAMGLMSYTEILGSFLIGHYRKNDDGEPRQNKHGDLIETSATDRFNSFFAYLGPLYEKILNNHDVYSELRCGLAHEYVIKKRAFTIYGSSVRLNDEQMDSLKNPIKEERALCGVIYEDSSEGKWHILNPKYFVDFKRAGNRLIQEIEKAENIELVKAFLERCGNTNLLNFIVQ